MKQKQPRKSKGQLIQEIENKKEISRKRKLIVEEFYPALIAATISVDESKALISALGSFMMEEVLKTMKERKFSDIATTLLGKLTADGQRVDEIARLLAILSEENLFVAREIIEGMTNVIERMIHDEMQTRNLDTLIPDWEKYLNT